MASLKSMNVGQLLALRDNVEKLLNSKRNELQSLLSQLGGVFSAKGPKAARGSRGKVAAKYRHPVTGETWSGRGGTVRWLANEIEAGKKKEDFLIGDASRSRSVNKKAKAKRTSKKTGANKIGSKKTRKTARKTQAAA